MKCFIQLSKTGDIISILPILYREKQITGNNAKLLVGSDYAGVLEGCSYIDPIIWPKGIGDLAGAIRHAKQAFSEVIPLQTHGNISINQSTSSFQFDQWKRAGCAGIFGEWPLVFDQRDSQREAELLAEKAPVKPFILFGDHSQSSPFLQKEELAALLKKEFPDHQIVRLSEIRARKPFDLIALYDQASFLVTVETMHAHLSRASKVPTVVLAANGWRGSAYREDFVFYLRYSEWNRRRDEMIAAMRGTLKKPAIKPVKTSFLGGYNYSLIDFNGSDASIYRGHTGGDWKTSLFLNDSKLKVSDSLADCSVEDARLFILGGKLHASYVVAKAIDGMFRCYMAYGEIRGNEIGHIRPKYPGNDFLGMTKNWTPLVHDNKLHFIYGIRGEDQIVLQVDGDRILSEYKSPAPKWGYGEIRGGCIVPHPEGLLRFFHSRQDYPDKTVRYFAGAAIMEAFPPFKTVRVSSRPILEGDERYVSGMKFWKANVVFPLGVKKSGGDYVLSFGRNDCECCTVNLTDKNLNL